MDKETTGESRKTDESLFGFWDNNLNTWQKNMFKFSEDLQETFKNFMGKGSKDDFFKTYREFWSEAVGNSMKLQSNTPGADLYKKMLDAANMYSEMLRSFASFSGKPGEGSTEDFKTFLDNWVSVQKNLFSNLFGVSLPFEFTKGNDLPKMLFSAFETYKSSISGLTSYFPQELKPFIDNFIDIMGKAVSTLQASNDPSKLSEFHDSWQQAYDDLVGKILQIPSIGPSRQLLDTLKRDADSFFNYLASSAEFYTTLYKPGLEAIEDTAKKATEALEDLSPDGFRNFYNFLLKNLEMKFFELFKSKGFGEAMKANLDASLEFRTRHFETLEALLKETPLVTHSEIDEVHSELYKLKKRVKELEKIIKNLKGTDLK